VNSTLCGLLDDWTGRLENGAKAMHGYRKCHAFFISCAVFPVSHFQRLLLTVLGLDAG